MGPPSRWQTRGGLSTVFHARPPRPSSAHEPEAHAGSFFFFFFFFHSLTASTCYPIRSFIASPLCHALPSSRRLRHVALVMHCPSSRLLRRVALSRLLRHAALSRRPIATRRPSSRVALIASPSLRRPSSRVAFIVSPFVASPSPCRPVTSPRRPSWLRASSKCPRICGRNGGGGWGGCASVGSIAN